MTYTVEQLQPLSAAVGRVIIEWNRVEWAIVYLGHALATCINPAPRAEAIDPVHVALLTMDLRARIKTTRAYASQCFISDTFFDELTELLNRVNNKHRPLRNHYVHSVWFCDDGPTVRAKVGMVVSKDDDGSYELKQWEATEYESTGAVGAFGAELADVYTEIMRLENKVTTSALYKAALEKLAVKI